MALWPSQDNLCTSKCSGNQQQSCGGYHFKWILEGLNLSSEEWYANVYTRGKFTQKIFNQ